MKRVMALFLTALLLLSLAACGGKDAWQEQYDLGARYVDSSGYVNGSNSVTYANGVAPVLSLTSELDIGSGLGTSSNPYQLNV